MAQLTRGLMMRYGFWKTWLVISLAILLVAVLASVGLMQLLMDEISRRGIAVTILISAFFILTVQRDYMQMVYELEKTRIKLDELSRTDDLTGAANRRSLLEKLRYEFVRSQRSGQSFILMNFDLDDFKRVNDHFGHPAGDRVLHGVAREVMSHIRENDTLARIGGDEFSLLLPAAKASEACEMVQRFTGLIEALEFQFGNETYSPKTSIGWAAWEPLMKNEDELLSAADRALYAEKIRRGRHR